MNGPIDHDIILILRQTSKNAPTRLKFREKRLETAREGKQSPMIIDCPWLYQNIKNK